MSHCELTEAIANLALQYPESAPNLNALLKAYSGEVTGEFPKGDWDQEQYVFLGTGPLRVVLDTYTDVLQDAPRPNISFSVNMLDYNGIITFKTLISMIQDKVFDHFINPLDNGASIFHNIEGAYDRGKLWLGYDGVELCNDQHGPYYLIKFID